MVPCLAVSMSARSLACGPLVADSGGSVCQPLPALPLNWVTTLYLLASGELAVNGLKDGSTPLGPVSGVVPGRPKVQVADSMITNPKKAVAAIR